MIADSGSSVSRGARSDRSGYQGTIRLPNGFSKGGTVSAWPKPNNYPSLVGRCDLWSRRKNSVAAMRFARFEQPEPMFVIQEERLIPVALTFEGWPQTKDDAPHANLTDQDIMVRGLTLTPDSFRRWLSQECGIPRICLLPRRSVVACTIQIISENKRPNIGNLPKPPKTPSSNRNFSNWRLFVKRWRTKSTIGGQVDNRNSGAAAVGFKLQGTTGHVVVDAEDALIPCGAPKRFKVPTPSFIV